MQFRLKEKRIGVPWNASWTLLTKKASEPFQCGRHPAILSRLPHFVDGDEAKLITNS
jgi:hypothetical protein